MNPLKYLLRSLFHNRFVRHQRGAVSILFAAYFVVALIILGFGVDLGRAYIVRSKLQNALDAALLYYASVYVSGATSQPADTIVNQYQETAFTDLFNANFPVTSRNPENTYYMGSRLVYQPYPVVNNVANSSIVKFSAYASATLDTIIMRLFTGNNHMTVNAFSEVSLNNPDLTIEVALVLDTTGSMSQPAGGGGGSSKLEGLKQAVQSYADIMYQNVSSNTNIYTSVVPYDVKVNIGVQRAAWVKDIYREDLNPYFLAWSVPWFYYNKLFYEYNGPYPDEPHFPTNAANYYRLKLNSFLGIPPNSGDPFSSGHIDCRPAPHNGICPAIPSEFYTTPYLNLARDPSGTFPTSDPYWWGNGGFGFSTSDRPLESRYWLQFPHIFVKTPGATWYNEELEQWVTSSTGQFRNIAVVPFHGHVGLRFPVATATTEQPGVTIDQAAASGGTVATRRYGMMQHFFDDTLANGGGDGDGDNNGLNDISENLTDDFPTSEATKFSIPTPLDYVWDLANVGGAMQPINPIVFASTDKNEITSAVNQYQPRNVTRVNVGLLWGWLTLSQKWTGKWGSDSSLPKAYQGDKAESDPSNYQRQNYKYIILMTDGKNTVYGAHDDDHTRQLCNEIKSLTASDGRPNPVFIYTIGFGAAGEFNSTLLQECATAPEYYYEASNNAQLEQAFRDISRKILAKTIRITK